MTTPSPNPVESLRALPEPPNLELDHIEYDGKYTVCYMLSNGTQSFFRVDPAMGKFIAAAWNRRPASTPDAELAEALAQIEALKTECAVEKAKRIVANLELAAAKRDGERYGKVRALVCENTREWRGIYLDAKPGKENEFDAMIDAAIEQGGRGNG